MGYGDWLMCTAQVKELHQFNGKQVHIIGRGNRPQWSEVFDHNPRITRSPLRDAQVLVNGSGIRPYIAGKTNHHWEWKRWKIGPGEIYLMRDEKEFGKMFAGKIVIEPNTKKPDGNKAWPWDRWQQVADAMPGQFIQVGAERTRLLDGVRFIQTTFRQACAVLSFARGFVGTEGGMHHAAAALWKPAVVLFSEFIGTDITGYPAHRNIRHAGIACGARLPCSGCRMSMQAITVAEVLANIEEAM